MRECTAKTNNDDKRWIVFDGPVDAIWIENMNTVLDDNKKLCLTSGEIIKLTNSISVMFEVQDLASASPATVSRCGMVYFEPKLLGWYLLIKSFTRTVPLRIASSKAFLENCLQSLIDASLSWTRKFGKYPVYDCEMTQVKTLVNLLSGLLSYFSNEEIRVPDNLDDVLYQLSLYALIWSVGAALDETSRKGFNDFLHEIISDNRQITEKLGLQLKYDTILPKIVTANLGNKNLFDISYDYRNNSWLTWTEVIKNFFTH